METIKQSNIELKLGDIIQIGSPTNSYYHENSYFIEYIDEYNIDIINISTLERNTLTINDSKRGFTDESIIFIALLHRNKYEGFARQQGLNVHTWIDIQIGGDYPKVFTGEITNLEEDMIEITTYPEKLVLNIDFEYKGLPRSIPIDSIKIRDKPKDIPIIEEETNENEQVDIDEQCDISRPIEKRTAKTDIADITVLDTLNSMYKKTKPLIQFGDDVDDITFTVEIPENEKIYNIDVQTNDLLDELLSSIPENEMTHTIENNIHNLIERFKQLRAMFSIFDEKMNVKKHLYKGFIHKPIVEDFSNLEKNIDWIIPVVSQKKYFYGKEETEDMSSDKIEITLKKSISSWNESVDLYKSNNTSERYLNYINNLDKFMMPFNANSNSNNFLIEDSTNMNVDTIIDNLGDFKSSVESENSDDGSKKFVVQRYINNPRDKIVLKSFLTLPEQFVRYSHISLPNTNILKKADYNNVCIHLYRLLNDKTKISSYIVNNLESEIDFAKENVDYINKIIDYSIDEKFMEDKERFIKMLKVTIPSTSIIIDDYVSKTNILKMSLMDIVKVLEPYMIYIDDICYHKTQLDKIRVMIEKRIDKYIADYEKNRRIYQKHIRVLNYDQNNINNIEKFFLTKPDLLETLQFGYNFEKDEIKNIGTSEFLNNLYMCDGASLLANLINFMNIDLHSSEIDILKQMEPPKLDDMGASIKSKDCSRKYLTKRYTSMKELQDDQDTDDVYYDKELDDTPYDILNNYKTEREKMTKDKFHEYLKENLLSIYNVQKDEVDELVETLIDGKKKVKENEYAVLSIKPKLPDNVDENNLSDKEKKQIAIEEEIREKIGYYKRVKKQWVFEPNIDPEIFIDSNTLFCNIQPNCFKNDLNKQCEPDDFTKKRMMALNHARMVKEFDSRITSELDNLSEKYENLFQKSLKFNKYVMRMNENKRYRFNNFAYEYGKTLKTNEIVLSPFLEVRDSILGEQDFVKKQSYILKFKETVCREALENENQHYYYCKKTDTKLLPTFYYELANAYLMNNNYEETLELICSKRGTISDDGDAIVDKHSGELIKKKGFVKEIQYTEDGYEVKTDEVLDTETIEEKISKIEEKIEMQSKNMILYENEMNGKIFNIISNICSKM